MPKILIAEDEPDIRDLIVFTLQFGGFEVEATSNGADAVERAPDLKPDLIVLDVRMPRMTGYEACRALKENPITSGIPIIFLSAKGQEAEVEAGMQAGAVEYILKPFAPDMLLQRIREVLAEHAAKPAAKPAEPVEKPAGVSETQPAEKPAEEKPPAPGAEQPAAPAETKPAEPLPSAAAEAKTTEALKPAPAAPEATKPAPEVTKPAEKPAEEKPPAAAADRPAPSAKTAPADAPKPPPESPASG